MELGGAGESPVLLQPWATGLLALSVDQTDDRVLERGRVTRARPQVCVRAVALGEGRRAERGGDDECCRAGHDARPPGCMHERSAPAVSRDRQFVRSPAPLTPRALQAGLSITFRPRQQTQRADFCQIRPEPPLRGVCSPPGAGDPDERHRGVRSAGAEHLAGVERPALTGGLHALISSSRATPRGVRRRPRRGRRQRRDCVCR